MYLINITNENKCNMDFMFSNINRGRKNVNIGTNTKFKKGCESRNNWIRN
jgi:hypothetical protein